MGDNLFKMKKSGGPNKVCQLGHIFSTTGVVEFSRMKICPCFWGEKSTQININSKVPKSISFLGKEKSGRDAKCVPVVSQTVYRSRSQTPFGS